MDHRPVADGVSHTPVAYSSSWKHSLFGSSSEGVGTKR